MSDSAQPVVFQLPNGLNVVLEENRSAPVVAMQMWVGTGSADELPEEWGIAHLHEHMLFKGTAKRGVGAIAADVEGAGGNINAWTSDDQTVYHLVVPAREFDMGLDILADAVQQSAFDPDELAKEIQVVLEEIRRAEDMPERAIYDALFETAYTKHPYRRTTLGTVESVSSVTREMILDFYHRWYVPGNMTLILVGDFDAADARQRVEKALGGFEKRPVPPRTTRVEEPEQKDFRATVIEGPYQKTYLQMAWPIPGAADPRVPALDALASVLGHGETSRLYKRVQDELQLVDSIGAYSMTPKDRGLMLVMATLDEKNLEPAIKAIQEEVAKVAAFDAGVDELDRVKINIESDLVYDKETMEGQARKLGFYATVLGGVEKEENYIKAISALTPADLRKEAQRVFQPDAATVAVLTPTGQSEAWTKDRLERLVRGASNAAEEKSLFVEKATDSAGITRAKLANGITLIAQPYPNVPLVYVRAVFLGGLLAEDAKSSGAGSLLSDMLTRGTTTRDAQRIAEEVEGIAGSIEGFSGKNSVGLNGEFLSRFKDRGLDLFLDILRNPAFDAKELEKSKRETLAALKRQEDSMSRVAFREFQKALYGSHPYSLDVMGTPESVKAMTPQKLSKVHARLFRPENLVLSVVGDMDADAMLSMLARELSDWESGYKPFSTPDPKFPAKAVVRELHRDKAQAHIIIGFPATRLTDEESDRAALDVLNAILSGQGGRLFYELRDKQSLAYSVSAIYQEGIAPGYFGFYLGCAPEKLEQARTGILGEIQKLHESGVTEDEIARAKRYLIGSHEIARQSGGSIATSLAFDERYGLGYDEASRYAGQIEKVTRADVDRVVKKYLVIERAVRTEIKPAGQAEAPRPKAGGRKAALIK